MNDSNHNNNADDNADLSDTFDSTFNQTDNPRSSDILKRFLNRVQDIERGREKEAVKGLNELRQTSSYEPLSEEGLRFVSTSDDSRADSTSVTASSYRDGIEIDFNDEKLTAVTETAASSLTAQHAQEDKLPSTANDNDNDNANNNNNGNNEAAYPDPVAHNIETDDANTKQSQTEQPLDMPSLQAVKKSSESNTGRKRLIIGMVSGIAISAVIVVLLSATGMLSNSADTADSDIESAIPSKSALKRSQAADEPLTTTATATDSPATLTAAAVDTSAATIHSANKNTATDNHAVSDQEPTVQETSLSTSSAQTDTSTEAIITYEDFREEAQSTLYREVKD